MTEATDELFELASAQVGHLPAEFQVIRRELDVTIATPFVLPNGRRVRLFLARSGEKVILTDFGEVLTWLSIHSLHGDVSYRDDRHTETAITRLGLDFEMATERGWLAAWVETPGEFARTLLALCQACVEQANFMMPKRIPNGGQTVSNGD